MKRKKGGVTSENQKKRIKTPNEAGIQTVACGRVVMQRLMISHTTWGLMTEVERLTASDKTVKSIL